MITEHKVLNENIEKLEKYIAEYGQNDNKAEFALKHTQLTAMKTYSDCLEDRLNMLGVVLHPITDRYLQEVELDDKNND